MLRTYLRCHVALAPLVFCVKAWAKESDLADASSGSLNSYAYTLLVVAYMQHRDLLPCLQEPLSGYRSARACSLAYARHSP
jgi:DNA polymerase sigma